MFSFEFKHSLAVYNSVNKWYLWSSLYRFAENEVLSGLHINTIDGMAYPKCQRSVNLYQYMDMFNSVICAEKDARLETTFRNVTLKFTGTD